MGKAYYRASIIDPSRLAIGEREQGVSSVPIANVGMIVSLCILIVPRRLTMIIQAEDLIKRRPLPLNALEPAVRFQETMGSPLAVNVEAGSIAMIIDRDDLCLGRMRKVLGLKSDGKRRVKPWLR